MTISEIATIIAEKVPDCTKKKAESFYNAFTDMLIEACQSAETTENKVSLPKIGVFTVTEKEAYMGKNPKTGEEVKVSARKRLSFKTYKSFKSAVNGDEEVTKETSKKSKVVSNTKNSDKKSPVKKISSDKKPVKKLKK